MRADLLIRLSCIVVFFLSACDEGTSVLYLDRPQKITMCDTFDDAKSLIQPLVQSNYWLALENAMTLYNSQRCADSQDTPAQLAVIRTMDVAEVGGVFGRVAIVQIAGSGRQNTYFVGLARPENSGERGWVDLPNYLVYLRTVKGITDFFNNRK